MINKLELNKMYNRYNTKELLVLDPLIVVKEFKTSKEQEAFGLVAALLAYGRVERIIISLRYILQRVNGDLFTFIDNTSLEEKVIALDGFKHRFNVGEDIAVLFQFIKYCYSNFRNLEEAFTSFGENYLDQLEGFTQNAKSFGLKYHSNSKKSFNYLFPSPSGKSACKRMNMYVRWMVRSGDGIDLGLWNTVSTADLIIPLDTHVAKISRDFGLTSRKDGSLRTAMEITESLKKFSPTDPLKYDFAISHFGMVDNRKK